MQDLIQKILTCTTCSLSIIFHNMLFNPQYEIDDTSFFEFIRVRGQKEYPEKKECLAPNPLSH